MWNLQNDRPVYLQLMEEIRRRIIVGQYNLGDKLPSVRDLAAEASVNPNTMQKALGELERQGLVYSQRTSGRFITDDVEKVRDMRIQTAKELTDEFMEKMRQMGLTNEDIFDLVQQTEEGKQ